MKPALVAVRTRALYERVFPLLQSLLAEEEKLDKKKSKTVSRGLSAEQSWHAYSLARKTGYDLYALVSAHKDVLAAMGLTLIHDPLCAKPYFRVNNLVVRKDARAQGLGTRLMREAEKIAKRHKAGSVILEVLPSNKKALLFYKSRKYAYLCDRLVKGLDS